MATALAAQLQALAPPTEAESRSFKQKTRSSILFDAREAADIDTATIFSLALSGLEELLTENPLFTSFKKSLFCIESCQTDREFQGHDFNASLNSSIRSFMYMLSDFALLSQAHQTLEYLIRRYKIHIYNVDDLLRLMLPYHETSLFVRIIQLTNIEKTRWRFLEGVRKSGAPPPRELLIQQCLHDLTVLEGICECGQMFKIGSKALRARTGYSFSVAIIIEVLGAAQTVDSTLVNKILTFVVQCFDKGSSEDSEIGGLMIIGTLVNKVKLSDEALALLFNLITKATGNYADLAEEGSLFEMVVMITIQIVQTQSAQDIPEKALRAIARVRQLPRTLSKLCASFNAEFAVTCLTSNLIKHCLSNHHYKQLLEELIRAVPLRGIAESMSLNLVSMTAEFLKSTDLVEGNARAKEVIKLLGTIKEAFPEEVDPVISRFLELHGQRKDEILTLLNSKFKGSLNEILPVSNQSIHRSLQHPKAHVRSLALQQAAAIAKHDPKMKVICSELLLLGLHDTELSVVESVLSVDGLEILVNAEEILSTLASVIERCVLLLENGPSASRAEAVSVGKHCLKFLSTVYLNAHPKYTKRVGFVLLCHMLVSPKGWKLNLAAIKAAKVVNWEFFKGLSAIKDESFKPNENVEKESRKLWMFELCKKMIEALAGSLSENLESLATDITVCATNFKRAKQMVMLVLLQCLTRVCEGLNWEAVNMYLAFLRQEWVAAEMSDDFPMLEIDDNNVIGERFFTFEFYKILYRDPKSAFIALLLACFYRALKCLPIMERGSRKVENSQAVFRVLEDMFEIFSSPRSKKFFEKHSRLLLKKISMPPVVFLSSFFNAESGMVPVSAQVNSLTVLLSHWNEASNLQKTDILSAVPHLVVALASPVKAVRKAAFECLRKLYQIWRDNSILPNGSQVQTKLLDSESFEVFLEAVMGYRDSFVSNGDFICTFLTSLLGFSNGRKNNEAEGELTVRLRFKKPTQIAIYEYLLRSALTMPLHAQATLIVSLRGAVSMKEQALETRSLLESLLKRWKTSKLDKSIESLPKDEVQIFRHLLQVHLHYEGMFSVSKGKINGSSVWFQTMMEVLNTQRETTLDDDTVETLCIALVCLEDRVFRNWDDKSQELILKRLINLAWLKPERLQLASRMTLQKLKVDSALLSRYINGILDGLDAALKEKAVLEEVIIEKTKSLSTVLELVVSHPNIEKMHNLIPSLFDSLRISIALAEVLDESKARTVSLNSPQQVESIHVSFIQQLVLEVLENILSSAAAGVAKDAVQKLFKVDFLVDFIRKTTNATTLNQSLSLLATFGREFPDLVLEHVISVFSVLGETTMIQDDTYSYVVTERLLAAVIPSWLQKTKNPRLLLQIFVKALPDIPNHRRVTLLKTTLSLMQESTSLHVLLLLLLERSLTDSNNGKKSQKRANSVISDSTHESENANWFEVFCGNFCEQYEVTVRLPALLSLLRDCKPELSLDSWKLGDKVILFICKQLDKVGPSVKMESTQNEEPLKVLLIKMLEETLSLLQKLTIDSLEKKITIRNVKESLQRNVGYLLESITSLLSPASFADAVVHLLKSGDIDMRIRALHLIAAKMNSSRIKDKEGSAILQQTEDEVSLDTLHAYEKLIETVGVLLTSSDGHKDDLIVPSISAIHSCSERLAKRIPSAFVSILDKLISLLQQTPFVPACLECLSSIIKESGLNVLPMLNEVFRGIMGTARRLQTAHAMTGGPVVESLKEADMHMGILTVLEAVARNLGSFLSPYLHEILDLLLLEPDLLSSANKRLNEKSESVRHLLTRTVPVRLLFEQLISVYDRAVQRGEASILACIEMLSLLVTSFDKPSVLAYYKAIFELCLRSFDLRRQHPDVLTSVTAVETAVISLFSTLVLKLSESTFKPLFVRVLEWAESEVPHEDDKHKKSVLRYIVFYRVINQLAEKLRSVFVPYFQYFLKGSVQQLSDGQDNEMVKPKKKPKMSVELLKKKSKPSGLTSSEWHLRYLIVCSLQKCFLYDTIGFLDTEKFQMLLGPLVQQIAIDRPAFDKTGADVSEWIPTTEDMDQALVQCLGQMALTAGTDLLWKPLNHEVLLCTRSEAVRVRIVSLDTIRFMVDTLKEDYLALLPETIPFLAELLEDSEQIVVTRSQEIIKLLEELSGESLAQYL